MSHPERQLTPFVARSLQHRFSRRTLMRGSTLAVSGLALSGLLAACGDDDDEATSTPSGQPDTTPGAEETPPSEQTPDVGETEEPSEPGDPGDRAGQPGGHLVIAFDADPEILDPHRTTALLASRVLAFMHDNLVQRDYDGQYVPELAEDWEISDDGTVYTFTLQQGVSFHSGKPMTSADVQYTFERWLGIEGSPTSYTIDPIESIEAPDDYTIVFNLSSPYNVFLDQLSGGWAVILNQEAVDSAGDSYGVETADGTGPFRFESWTRNQSLQLTRFEDYAWGSPMFENQGPAYVESAEVRIVPEATTRIAEFQSGNLHLVATVPPVEVERLRDASGVDIVEFEQLQTTYLGMNMTVAPTDDIEVRRAVAYGIDRASIVEGANFGLGQPAVTMLHPNTPHFWQGSLDEAPDYDPDLARQILEDAGWIAGNDGIREKDGQRLVMPLWVINDEVTTLQAQIIEEQLADVGIEVDTTQYEQTAWFEAARSGDQTAFIIGVFYSSADVLYFYFYSEQQPAPNRFFIEDPEVDEWLLDSRSNPDEDAVAETFENIQRRLIESNPAVPLVHLLGTLGRAEVVQGVEVHTSRWLNRLLDIWIDG